jgi:DNA-binding transcriptional MerR regulator
MGLVAPSADAKARRYSFRDLVALRVLASLLDSGLAVARIRRALRYLAESGDDIAGLHLVTDGTTVWACRDDGQILDALRHGQLALFLAIDHVAADVEAEVRAFDAERAAFVDGLREQAKVSDAGGTASPSGAGERDRSGGANARARSRRRRA